MDDVDHTAAIGDLCAAVQQYIKEALAFAEHQPQPTMALEPLAEHLLARILTLCNTTVGYVAVADPLNDANMQYAAVRGLHVGVGTPFRCEGHRTLVVPAAHRHRWLTWPLVFHNRVRGCVGTSNG